MGNLFRKPFLENFLREKFGVPNDLLRIIGGFCNNNKVDRSVELHKDRNVYCYSKYPENEHLVEEKYPESECLVEESEQFDIDLLECPESVNYVIYTFRTPLIIYAPRRQSLKVVNFAPVSDDDYIVTIEGEIKKEILMKLLRSSQNERISYVMFNGGSLKMDMMYWSAMSYIKMIYWGLSYWIKEKWDLLLEIIISG